MKRNILLAAVFSMTVMSSCSKDISKYKGTYRNIQKADSYDGAITTYKKNSYKYNSGISISVSEDKLMAKNIKLQKGKKTVEIKGASPYTLAQTDEEMFQYKNETGSSILTFIFSYNTLFIDEYSKDKYGNIRKESRHILKKIK